jgi:hypothetical protein
VNNTKPLPNSLERPYLLSAKAFIAEKLKLQHPSPKNSPYIQLSPLIVHLSHMLLSLSTPAKLAQPRIRIAPRPTDRLPLNKRPSNDTHLDRPVWSLSRTIIAQPFVLPAQPLAQRFSLRRYNGTSGGLGWPVLSAEFTCQWVVVAELGVAYRVYRSRGG